MLEPLLLVIGGWLYLKSSQPKTKVIGQIILGLALILVSLHLLREVVEPLRESPILPAAAAYIESDALTGFLIGAALAFVLHSSVAAILMTIALVAAGGLSFQAGLTVILGANLGGALIAVWLSRDHSPMARRIPLANALAKGGAACVILLVMATFNSSAMQVLDSPAGSLLLLHLLFNVAVLAIFLPVAGALERPTALILPVKPSPGDTLSELMAQVSSVDQLNGNDKANAAVITTAAQQDILKMLEEVERMYRPIFGLFDTYSDDTANTIRQRDEQVNAMFSGLRRYIAEHARGNLPKATIKELRAQLDYAIRIEAAGDLVAKRMTAIANELNDTAAGFSDAGREELQSLHGLVLAGFGLARHVLLADDLEAARRLTLDKAKVKRKERSSRKAHMKRLERSNSDSLATSDMHLELLRALRELFGHIAAVAYPILYREGQVLETRLISEEPEQD